MAKSKKTAGKRAGKKAARPAAKKKAAARKPAKVKSRRQSWLDDDAQTPVIEKYARQLKSFLSAMADGVVDRAEVKSQEQRLVKLMKDLEPRLSDDLHARVTQVLCELTAYDLMQVLHAMHAARPKTAFRG